MDGRSKQALRAAVLAVRSSLSAADRAKRSHLIAERLAVLEVYRRARTVALYASMGAEVDTTEIAGMATAAGKRLAYPRMSATEGGRGLSFAECALEALVQGPQGTREPPASAAPVAPAEIDVVIVPGVAFDAGCHRLGRGRGHYDATLAALPATATRIGLAFELQVLADVPQDPHDAPLDAVVTEARVLFRGNGAP